VFGGGEAALGDPIVQGTAGAAPPEIVGPQLAAVQGTGASEFVGQGLPELGGFGPVTPTDFSAAMPIPAGAYVPSASPEVVSNLSIPGTYGTGQGITGIGQSLELATPSANLVTASTPVPVDAVTIPTGLELKEGVTELSRTSAANLASLPTEAGFTDLGVLTKFDPKTMNALDFAKYAAKPMTTAGAAGIGLDAATGQGAFEPIDYSSFPQAGEERRVSPFDTSGIRFASRRTGAFPRTEEEALAFAQPGGNRQRFFDQRFFTSAKTGGGLAALQVGGQPKTALDAAMTPDDEDDDIGGLGTGTSTTSSASGGLSNQTTGGLIGSGLGALGKAAMGIGMFSLPGMAISLGSNLVGQTIGAQQDEAEADAALAAAVASIAEDEMSIEDEDTTSNTQAAADAVAAAQAAAASQAAAAQAMAEMDDFSATSGDGGTGGGVDSSGAGPGSGFGDSGFGGPGGEEDSDSDGGSSGGGGAGPGGDGSEGSQGDDLKTGGLISEVTGMASGGDLKDIMGFLSPVYGIGRAIKKRGLEGLMTNLSPAFAMSQGKLPMGLDNLMGSKASAPAPAARSAEAPVQAKPAPTVDELEELQNVAIMQQVLAGQPVEAQMGGLVSTFAMGGMPSPYFEGRVAGPGDGMSDSIPFTIEGTQPAILSRDEYVLPADIVSMMGNGSSDAGAEKIDTFINDFRVQKYGRGEQPPETRRGLSGVA
jgi:hypothetical protein